MKNLLCIFGRHKWTSWNYYKPIGRYEHKLMRKCSRCAKIDYYVGLTETCIVTGKQTPYIYKD